MNILRLLEAKLRTIDAVEWAKIRSHARFAETHRTAEYRITVPRDTCVWRIQWFYDDTSILMYLWYQISGSGQLIDGTRKMMALPHGDLIGIHPKIDDKM